MVSLFSGWGFGKKSAKRYTRDYGTGSTGVDSDPVAETIKEYLESDPEFASNVRRFVDNVMIKAPRLVSTGAARSTVEGYMEQLKNVRYYKLLRAAMYQLIWNGNAFLEIKFKGKQLKELYSIDPETITIVMTEDGREVAYYEQHIKGSPIAIFQPDEIIHISIDHLDSGIWGKSFIKPLQESLKRKAVAESYLEWLIAKNKTSPIIAVKAGTQMDEDMWERIIAELDEKSDDPDLYQIIGLMAEDQVEIIRIFSFDDMDKILKYIDTQNNKIMNMLQVPPIIAGTVDNSNRSNSEIQARLVFYNTIKAFQNLIKEELDYEMLRKLWWRGVEFKFSEVDERMNVELIKLAKSMRVDLNMTENAVEEFLKMHGFHLPDVDKLFDEVPVDAEYDINDAESRQPRDKTGIPQNEAQMLSDREAGM